MKQIFKLNLDPDFDPTPTDALRLSVINGTFPGGEPNIRITDDLNVLKGINLKEARLIISQRFTQMSDIVTVIVAADAARRLGFAEIELVMPYFPAARQDRVCNRGESLTIKVFADMINSCGFSAVHIYAPHSEVTPALINNCVIIDDDIKFLQEIMFKVSRDQAEVNIVCPDAGAGKRTLKLAKEIASRFPDIKINFVRCEKVRDVETGALKEFFVADSDLGGFPSIICDDIVAYGGTFKGLGEELRKRNSGKLYLFTSHADCKEGLQNMVGFFDGVYTSNSRKDWQLEVSGVTCFKILL
jgi:ribose-phosphate pyrophosphokinase